jgi:ABC-type nitrate/sulfonate/bicarbonate transport system substrate-binding protein
MGRLRSSTKRRSRQEKGMFGDASRVTIQLPAPRRRAIVGGALAGLGVAALAGCGAAGQGTANPAPAAPPAPTARPVERTSLRLSWIKNTEFAGFFVAQEKGYYKDEALDVTINGAAQNLSEVQAVASRADVIGLSGGASLMLARGQGIPVKAFGALFQKGPGCFVWLQKSGIKGIADFRGKKLGHQQTARASTEAMLTMHKIPVDEVRLQTIGFGIEPLLTGEVDILTGLVTNQVVLLEQQGEQVGFVPYSDLGFAFYWNTPFVLDDTFRDRKDMLAYWLRASARGWDYALKNPDEVAKLVVEKYGEGLDLQNQTIELKRETPLIRTEFTTQRGLFWMDPAVWRTGHDLLLNATKQLDKPLNLDDVQSLDVLARIGKVPA